jgi:hypothetical protein
VPALAPVAALAQTDAAHDAPRLRYDLGVTAGTLGVGPEVGVRFGRHTGVRANATFLNISRTLTVDGNRMTFRRACNPMA